MSNGRYRKMIVRYFILGKGFVNNALIDLMLKKPGLIPGITPCCSNEYNHDLVTRLLLMRDQFVFYLSPGAMVSGISIFVIIQPGKGWFFRNEIPWHLAYCVQQGQTQKHE